MGKDSEDIKGNEHPATSAHPDSSHHDAEFISQVRALRDAEKSAAERVEGAKKEGEGIEASARESAVGIISKAEQKAVEAKNEIIAKRREQSESEIAAILGAAKKQANAIRTKRLTDTDVAEVSQDI